jgi:hypothetical protein
MKRMTLYEICLGLDNERLCGSADAGDAIEQLWKIIEGDSRLKQAGIKIHYVHGPDCAVHAEGGLRRLWGTCRRRDFCLPLVQSVFWIMLCGGPTT